MATDSPDDGEADTEVDAGADADAGEEVDAGVDPADFDDGLNAAAESDDDSEMNPILPALCSFVIPGAGQAINGDYGKAIALFLGYLVSIGLIFVFIGLLTTPALHLYGVYDAFTSAQD